MHVLLVWQLVKFLPKRCRTNFVAIYRIYWVVNIKMHVLRHLMLMLIVPLGCFKENMVKYLNFIKGLVKIRH
ncbi:hypothetical protein VI26_16670 [Chromobacterium sp. LK1]|nr:hypothetical protein VI26_16670 [Chromobacterium sp. LK1]